LERADVVVVTPVTKATPLPPVVAAGVEGAVPRATTEIVSTVIVVATRLCPRELSPIAVGAIREYPSLLEEPLHDC
jgi:hypothetical protein